MDPATAALSGGGGGYKFDTKSEARQDLTLTQSIGGSQGINFGASQSSRYAQYAALSFVAITALVVYAKRKKG